METPEQAIQRWVDDYMAKPRYVMGYLYDGPPTWVPAPPYTPKERITEYRRAIDLARFLYGVGQIKLQKA